MLPCSLALNVKRQNASTIKRGPWISGDEESGSLILQDVCIDSVNAGFRLTSKYVFEGNRVTVDPANTSRVWQGPLFAEWKNLNLLQRYGG
jgi:hypothetical protein